MFYNVLVVIYVISNKSFILKKQIKKTEPWKLSFNFIRHEKSY